jgi:hypothetical protein
MLVAANNWPRVRSGGSLLNWARIRNSGRQCVLRVCEPRNEGGLSARKPAARNSFAAGLAPDGNGEQ